MDLEKLSEQIKHIVSLTEEESKTTEKEFVKSIDSLFTDIKSFMSSHESTARVDRAKLRSAQQDLLQVQAMIAAIKKQVQREGHNAVRVMIATLEPHKLIQFSKSIEDLSEFLKLGDKIEPTEGIGKGGAE